MTPVRDTSGTDALYPAMLTRDGRFCSIEDIVALLD